MLNNQQINERWFFPKIFHFSLFNDLSADYNQSNISHKEVSFFINPKIYLTFSSRQVWYGIQDPVYCSDIMLPFLSFRNIYKGVSP
jgi:hypothetical protein